ncbi:MAG TPA: putative Ig domain-containing protein [Phototrophicaceae bacterium]|nr:putative Ig domain-containing protein [Phototrophicaceae bacterium]
MVHHSARRLGLASLFTVFLFAMVSGIVLAAAPELNIPTFLVNYAGTPLVIAPDLTITDGGESIDGASVAINANYVMGEDQLQINGMTSGSVGSINYIYSVATGILSLTNLDSAANYQDILRLVTYVNGSGTPTGQPRQVVFSLGGSLNNPDNGHYYDFMVADNIHWDTAKAQASTLNYYGLQGYLATVTSASENAFIAAKLVGEGWMGASDDPGQTGSAESHWYWVTGPEAGTEFCVGAEDECIPQNGAYTNWNEGEPNNCCGSENFGHFLNGGKWNDYYIDNTSIAGYVVEYGGMAGDPTLKLSDSIMINVGDNSGNLPPILDTIFNQSVTVGATVSFTAVAGDPNGDALTFSLAGGAPVGASIDANSGAFSWTTDTVGSFDITVIVSDGELTDEQTFNVKVNSVPNAAPVLDPIGNKTGTVGTQVAFTATASDADNDTLTFSLGAGAPAGAAIDANSGAFTWTPAATGDFNVTVVVSDGNSTDQETITISVSEPVNQAPVLDPIADQTGMAGTILLFDADATDPDGDTLTYSMVGAPAGSTMDSSTGKFSWTPDLHGIYTFTVVVTDPDSLTDQQVVTATISEELVQNGDFEQVDGVNTLPYWVTGHLDKGEGKRKCDDTPNCYFLFKHIRDFRKTKLKQVVDATQTATLLTGDTLTLSVNVAPKKAKGKFAVAKVFYVDTSIPTDYIRLTLPPSGAFQVVTSDPMTIKGPVAKVRVMLTYKKPRGKYKADDISLIVTPGAGFKGNFQDDGIHSASPLPLPAPSLSTGKGQPGLNNGKSNSLSGK